MRWLYLFAASAAAVASFAACQEQSTSSSFAGPVPGNKRAHGQTDDWLPPTDAGGTSTSPPFDASPGVCGVLASSPPGTLATSRDAKGANQCASVTIGEVIDAARKLDPTTPNVSEPFHPNDGTGGEAPRVLAYITPLGGFALAFIDGSGDCPAGCINHRYWYFETNPSATACTLTAVGKYSTNFDSAGNCYAVEGAARWGQPPPIKKTCAVDAGAPFTTKTYALCGSGGVQTCGAGGVFDGVITFRVVRDSTDPTRKGTVFIDDGTKNPNIDGHAFLADFKGDVVDVQDSVPTSCGTKQTFVFHFDPNVTTGFAGGLEYEATPCTDAGASSCLDHVGISMFASPR